MDYFGADRKLSELGEQDLEDFLDQDMFTPPCSDSGMDQCIEQFGLDACDPAMDNKWLDEFFDDPVLNDRMMTDALQPRRVQSEHSYSLTNGEKIALDGQIKMEVTEKDLEVDLLGSAINPNMTLASATTTTIINNPHITTVHAQPDNGQMMETINLTDTTQRCSSAQLHLKHEPIMCPDEITMATNSITASAPVAMTTRPHVQPHPQTLLKQPTIILATQQQHSTPHMDVNITSLNHPRQERYVLPKVDIKTELLDTASNMSSPEHSTMYDSIGLPPTPPSSSNSDSEGSVSPQRSAPPSPIRHSQMLRQHVHTQHTLGGASAALAQQPLFSSPIPTSGVLILSEEEKRTLVAEGYPIPNKLPLTKQEEKNLKKIRRKIKNKISAQESRRKKKEYLETLEKKVESYNSENCDLKKKVDQLENNNRSLIGQLQKLQSLVAKVPRPTSPATQTGTCLMVLVLFFAVFMGTWSPMTWSIGYGSTQPSGVAGQSLSPAVSVYIPSGPLIGPEIQEPVSDAYSTPNMRSRVLMSIRDDLEETFGPHVPFSYKDFFMRWFSDVSACHSGDEAMAMESDFSMEAPLPHIAAEETSNQIYPQMPDMAANYTAQVLTTPTVNTTA